MHGSLWIASRLTLLAQQLAEKFQSVIDFCQMFVQLRLRSYRPRPGQYAPPCDAGQRAVIPIASRHYGGIFTRRQAKSDNATSGFFQKPMSCVVSGWSLWDRP